MGPRLRLPKYIHAYFDRHGKPRHYLRRPGRREAPLPGMPWSKEFMEAYAAAMSEAAPVVIGAKRSVPGTVAEAVASYLASAALAALAPSTQAMRRAILQRFRDEHGDKRLRKLQPEHVARLISKLRPYAQRNMRKTLRGLMSFALAEGLIDVDPSANVKLVPVKDTGGFETWPVDRIEQYRARHKLGTRPRLALELLYGTMQRRGDVVLLGRQHIHGAILSLRQQKSGAQVDVPVLPELQAAIDAMPEVRHLTFLVTELGKPFTAAGFGGWFRDQCNEAGLPKNLSAHGLRKAGATRLAEHGCTDRPDFIYDPDWIGLRGAFPISTTMPLKSERIASDIFLPWAANLLPESQQLRTLGQLLGMARSDVIGLLSAIGGDTAGALSIGQSGRTASVHWQPVGKPEDLEKVMAELPNKPFLVGEAGVSMSLAGVQAKLAVAVDDTGRVCIPMNGSPSTHILKPAAPRLWGSVQNEAFCLTLARRMKIPTLKITTGQAGKRAYLLAQRYDRMCADGRWRRLHQEDYCQAVGIPPSAKYESNQTGIPGPTLKDIFEVTRRHMPPTDVVRLLDMVVVNVLVCNTDAHAKNYSIMIRGNGASLAPLYDVMCGEPWENVTKNLAQKIAGKTRGDYLTGRDWQLFARECGLNPKQVIDRVETLAKSVISEAEAAQSEVAAMPAGGHAIVDQARHAVERRARTLLSQLQEFGGDPVAGPTGRAEEAEAATLVSIATGA